MRIIFHELKKLFNWKILLILLVFTGLYYFMFLDFDLIHYYPNGHPSTERYEIGIEMMEKYGTTIDAAERKDFEATSFQNSKNDVNHIISELKVFQDAKISNIDELEAMGEEGDKGSKAKHELYNRLYGVLCETKTAGGDVNQALYFYQEKREDVTSFHSLSEMAAVNENYYSGHALERKKDILGRTELSTLPSWPVLTSWDNMARYFSLLLLITVMVLVAPFLVRDRMSGVQQIAYTCRKGRRFYFTRMAAALITAALGVAAQCVVFFALYFNAAHRNDPVFFGCNISGLENDVYWFDLTFGQYIVIAVALMVVLALGFVFFSFVISRFCKTYVAILAVLIPLAVAENYLCEWIFKSMFLVCKPQCGEIWACAVALLTGLLLCFVIGRREQKIDIA